MPPPLPSKCCSACQLQVPKKEVKSTFSAYEPGHCCGSPPSKMCRVHYFTFPTCTYFLAQHSSRAFIGRELVIRYQFSQSMFNTAISRCRNSNYYVLSRDSYEFPKASRRIFSSKQIWRTDELDSQFVPM